MFAPNTLNDYSQFLPLFRFLQVSPTYELARLYRLGERSKIFLEQLPDDFDEVLVTFDKFGSVMDEEDCEWLRHVPSKHFDSKYSRPPLKTLGFIGVDHKYEGEGEGVGYLSVQSLVRSFNEYVESYKKSKDDSIYQVIVFKTHIGLPSLIEHFKFNVTEGRSRTKWRKKVKSDIENKKFSKLRIHAEKIEKGVQLLLTKAGNPSLANWRLGEKVKYSQTFDKRINNPNLPIEEVKEAQVEYGKLVYRALKKFERMAENAARGKYPCDDPIPYKKFDYLDIQTRLNAYDQWVLLNPIVYPVHPPLPEVVTMEEIVKRLNTPPLPRDKFEIDNRQKKLF